MNDKMIERFLNKARHSFSKTEQERIIDPTGVLAASNRSGGLNAEERAALSEYRRKIESGEIVIQYP